jgi:DNA repair protein RadC
MGQDLVFRFAGLQNERAFALFFDNSLCFCGEELLHEGNINSVGFSIRKLCDAAVRFNASYMVLAHNHPRGLPIASSEDLSTTSELRKFLLQMNVVLIDHFIIGENRFTSIQKQEYKRLRKGFLEKAEVLPEEPFNP